MLMLSKRMLTLIALLLVAQGLLVGQCAIDARVTKGTHRTDGNHMEGYSVAWASAGDWWHWVAVAHGVFYFTPSGGSPQQLADGYSSGPLSGGDWSDPENPRWDADTDLDSKGNGAYFVSGWGDFFSTCGDQYYNIGYGQSPNNSVTRPTIVGPNPSQPNWAFWYLGGAPSIDGYYVQAGLQGVPNWSAPPGQQVNYSWVATAQPTKVSINPTNGTSTVLTSRTASDGMVYDVKIVFKVDGFSSEEFPIHINRPDHLNFPTSIISVPSGTGCPGYEASIDYTGRDLWGYALVKITTNETFTNWGVGNTPPVSGWPKAAQAVWNPSDPNEWVGDFVFRDTIWAYDCSGTWNPTVLPPSGGNDLVRFATQRIYMGSGTYGSGQQVQSGTMKWYRDHGGLNP